MYRIRVDFQKPGREDLVWLSTLAATHDLARIPNLADGMEVIVYDPFGFAMRADLVLESDGVWSAKLHHGTEIDCAIGTAEQRRAYLEAVWEVVGAQPGPSGTPRFTVGQSVRIVQASVISWFSLLDPWQPPLDRMIDAARLATKLSNAGRSVVVAEVPPSRNPNSMSPGDLRYRLKDLPGTWPEELLVLPD